MAHRSVRPHRGLTFAAAVATTVALLASAPSTGAAAEHAGAPTKNLAETFGIDVGDRDDSVAQMLQLSGGLRVMKVEPGSVGSRISYPGIHRPIGRGDFILKVRVKGVDEPGDLKSGVITTPADFANACKRARRLIWEQPGHKGTLAVDVFTQAGYNMEDWKSLTFEGPLDLSGQPEPPKVDTTPMKAPVPGAGV
ncbi:MAG: hypothetical protein IPK07_21770 [Deltaproteobacteria bacterium]|nr:hypothetical protein [Deltaproteobacteria bacterium]